MKDKKVLLTGVNTGIGFGLAQSFLAKGALLGAVCRSTRYFSFLQTEFSQISKNFHLFAIDLETNFSPVLENVEQEFGRPDIIVNNAAIFYPDDTEVLNLDNFTKSFFVNVRAVAIICRYFIELMKENGGLIVNMLCNAEAQKHLPHSSFYKISKYALRELTLTLEQENIANLVKITGLYPRWTKTRTGGINADNEISVTVDQLMTEIVNLSRR